MEGLLPSLKNRVASFIPLDDVIALSQTSKSMRDDIAFALIPMQIPFKSWYDESKDGPQLRRGPRLPFLHFRTHSVTISGSWSCCFGELYGKSSRNFKAQFYIMAYPSTRNEQDVRPSRRRKGANAESAEMGRIVWASSPIYQKHKSQSDTSWVNLTATFVPKDDEDYFLCIQPGPGKTSNQHWWRHCLQMSNLVAVVHYHDEPRSNFLLKRQYQTVVKHMLQVENRGSYYTKILEAIARSIRIQLARLGRNALDPVLEGFFELTGVSRDTESLLALEEIARFLSQYSYISERRRKCSSFEHDSTKEGSSSHADPSVPDWIPCAELSAERNCNAMDDSSSSRSCVWATNDAVASLNKENKKKQRSAKRLGLHHLRHLFRVHRILAAAKRRQRSFKDCTVELSERDTQDEGSYIKA